MVATLRHLAAELDGIQALLLVQALAQGYLDHGGPYPDHLLPIAVNSVFLVEYVAMWQRWLAEAIEAFAGAPTSAKARRRWAEDRIRLIADHTPAPT